MSLAKCVVRVAIGCVLAMRSAAASAVEPLTPTEQARYADLDARGLQTFTNVDLADFVRLRAKRFTDDPQRPPPAAEVAYYALKATTQPFRRNAVQFDLAEADCVSFVNRNLALSLSHDWASYYRLTERLRYKNGVVEYRNRNFATLGDWLPNNMWIMRDITGDIGPADARPAQGFTHFVRPKVFHEAPAAPGSKYVRTVFRGSDYKSGVKEARADVYIPRDRLPDVLKDLRTGDVFLVIRGVPKNPGCDHMGFIEVAADGGVNVLHSAPPKVHREPLKRFLERVTWINGMKFLRLRDDAPALAEAELSRLAASIQPPEPAKQDTTVKALRAARAKDSKSGQ